MWLPCVPTSCGPPDLNGLGLTDKPKTPLLCGLDEEKNVRISRRPPAAMFPAASTVRPESTDIPLPLTRVTYRNDQKC